MKSPLILGLCLAAFSLGSARAGELSLLVKSAKGETVADAVVSLTPMDVPVPPPAAGATAVIAQQDQEYSTYVTVVQAGSRVVFPNKDTVQHHVYSLSKAKKFELPLYNPGQAESIVFEVPGVITLGCNIHDWMLAYLIVVPTPYFAKTDSLGAARVSAPAGRYKLEVWHPRQTTAIAGEVVLVDGTPTAREFTLALKTDRRIRRGPDSKSGGYR